MKLFSVETLKELSKEAAASQRKRCNLNIHERLDEEVQRLFLAFEPDTYVRPHRHPQSHKWELFVLLHGDIDLLIFDDEGEVRERINLSERGQQAVEIPANTWHSYISNVSGSLALEVKQGGYIPQSPQDFAAWAPDEKDAQASAYLAELRQRKAAVNAG